MQAAALYALAVAFAPTIQRYYKALSSVAYHNELRLAQLDGNDGMLVAFLDEEWPDHQENERAFNKAAKAFGCLPPGGTHMVLTGEDDRAKFIAADLRELHHLPDAARPPVVAYFKAGKPVSWISATGGGGDGAATSGGWTAPSLVRWVYSLFNLAYVADGDELTAFHNDAAERIALAVYTHLCEGDAAEFVAALKNHTAKAGHPIYAAVSTNTTLGEEACGLPDGRGVCALLGFDKGPRLTLPEALNHTADEIEEWLAGLTRPQYQKLRGGDKSEL